MKLNPDSLARHLAQELNRVYLISGDEPLLVGEAADAVRARARALGFTEREVHVLDRGTDWDAVRASADTRSLFAARRIIELKLQGKPGVAGGRALERMARTAADDALLIITTARLDRDAQGADWVRAVEARGVWIAVWPIPAERMPAWLGARCRQLGLDADPRALELLAERTRGNLLAARQELEKLQLLYGAQRLDVERVLAGTADSARFSVGELSLALAAGQLSRSLRILDGLKGEGVELPLVLWAVIKAMHESASRHTAPERSLPAADGQARRRAARLAERALRADAMAKGRIAGNAWDELALLACELCGRTALPFTAAA
ncbi:MAG TPA: DNA polymerase III subunit delta [Steroidobacteraceae bacterium]|nr:DNA polymerase III subunit delta [Steroidobacteraceae bacterium]